MNYKVLIAIDHEEEPGTNCRALLTKVLRVYNENEFEQAEADYQMVTSVGGFKSIYLLPTSFQVNYESTAQQQFISGYGVNVALLNMEEELKKGSLK